MLKVSKTNAEPTRINTYCNAFSHDTPFRQFEYDIVLNIDVDMLVK